MLNLDQRVTISEEVLSQEVSGETVLLDLGSENYFGLDEVGTRIWQLLKENGHLRAVFDTMLTEYEVDEARLAQDLDNLLTEISDLGLISLEPIT